MTTSKASRILARGKLQRVDIEVLRDIEAAFRDAHRDDPCLCVQRFVDGTDLVRQSGHARFTMLAIAAARGAGYRGSERDWIEGLLEYLLAHDRDREYLKVQRAALYVNPVKARLPMPQPSDLSWNQAGATIGYDYTIGHLFKASADFCLWLIFRQTDGRHFARRCPKNTGIEDVRIRVRQMLLEGATHQQVCQRLKDAPRPPRAEWRHLPWDRAYIDAGYRSSVAKWLSKNCRP